MNMTYSTMKNDKRKPHAPLQNVIRIKQPSPQYATETPSADLITAHSRRSHRKSRYGCRNCKNRRLKCDETKPECTRCLKHGIQCDYIHTQPKSESKSSQDLVKLLAKDCDEKISPDTTAGNMSLVAVNRSISQIVGFDGWDTMHINSGSSELTNLEILHSFVTDCTRSIMDPKIKVVMRTGMIGAAFTSAHLMHTILAASCLFLNRVRPGNRHREVLEIYHWQRAIQLYQTELTGGKIGSHNTDALIGSCILLGMNDLCPVGYKPEQSWVFTSNPADLNWLALQGGLCCLIDLTKPFIDDSIWGSPFRAARDQMKPFSDDQTGRVGLHDELADLCEIDDNTTSENNAYHWPVQLLSRMLKLEPHNKTDNYNIFVTWMGRIPPDFITCLRKKDERALLVLSWWMALMCAVSSFQPWIQGRIIPECQAICMYLESTSEDPEILRLIEWPAKACRYRESTPRIFEDMT